MPKYEKNKKQVVALIPLRGGSKSIPQKNIKNIGGKPLCAWVIEAAVNAKEIDRVYVSTDSTEIETVVNSLDMGVEIIHRPDEYATDTATTESVMQHFMELVSFDLLVTIQATSPFLFSSHLDEALLQFYNSELDSMLSAVRTYRFFWNDNGTPINYDPLNRPRRQEFPGILMENGAFYITSGDLLKRTGCRLAGNIGLYEMPSNSAIEIDELEDWEIVSHLLRTRKE
jgi:CMP-N-acetylneuraminic acid synthetase